MGTGPHGEPPGAARGPLGADDASSSPDATAPPGRAARWASTMTGFTGGELRFAHAAPAGVQRPGAQVPPGARQGDAAAGMRREDREAGEASALAPWATVGTGGGRRRRPEEPDPWRTCFERDRDRILHSAAFRRLAGKTQVFVFPEDHQRTRLTHALEVAQVAMSVARACRLNVALTEAIALGHDCGHGPGGHASEEALDPFLQGGFDHATWGADVSLASLNLCEETADGIRNHSWSRPAPATPEGEVVSWADRVAYVCHDWEDAVRAGIVSPSLLPAAVRERCGDRRSVQLGAFIDALARTVLTTGRVAMTRDTADALAAFRSCNYEHIYLRDASVAQARAVVAVLRALVEHFGDRPNTIPAVREAGGLAAGEPAAVEAAVTYVAGMTDRYACRQAVALLDWDPAKLPRGVNG
jgi:dGTPase